MGKQQRRQYPAHWGKPRQITVDPQCTILPIVFPFKVMRDIPYGGDIIVSIIMANYCRDDGGLLDFLVELEEEMQENNVPTIVIDMVMKSVDSFIRTHYDLIATLTAGVNEKISNAVDWEMDDYGNGTIVIFTIPEEINR